MKLSEIKINKNNPRTIQRDKMEKLKRSIEQFPKMMELRPIVIDNNKMILGGNMRYLALKELGHTEIPDEWVKFATQLTDEEKNRFIIEDNVGFGDWDWDILANEWDAEELEEWGLELKKEKKESISGEIKFSDELDMESNYVVLKFNKDIDFIHIQEILGMDRVYSRRRNGKPWSIGIGRIYDGISALEKIKKWK